MKYASYTNVSVCTYVLFVYTGKILGDTYELINKVKVIKLIIVPCFTDI